MIPSRNFSLKKLSKQIQFKNLETIKLSHEKTNT